MHTTDMLRAAEKLCDIYQDKVDRNLLLSGVILHDIGKIAEFEINASSGLVSEYSLIGNALGHSIIGVMEIEGVSRTLHCGRSRVVLLQNLIASHHGKAEYTVSTFPICLTPFTCFYAPPYI